MKITNQTHWRTDHLKAFVNRVAQDELDPEKRKSFRVYFTYARGHGFSSGHAPYHGNRIHIRLSSGNNGKLPSKTDLAMVIAHEIAHSRGMHHWQMQGGRYNRRGDYKERYAWAELLPLEKKEKKPKLVDQQQIRYQQVLAGQKRWESKLKRAQTALRKLRQKERYYSKALAAKRAASAKDEHNA